MNALSALRFFLRKSTQDFSRAGTAYFLAVYSVVITVSGPIWTSSEYKNLERGNSYFVTLLKRINLILTARNVSARFILFSPDLEGENVALSHS